MARINKLAIDISPDLARMNALSDRENMDIFIIRQLIGGEIHDVPL